MPHRDTEYLTSSQVAALIGKSQRTVLRLVEAGLLPVALQLPGPNGARLFRRADVAHYLADRAAS